MWSTNQLTSNHINQSSIYGWLLLLIVCQLLDNGQSISTLLLVCPAVQEIRHASIVRDTVCQEIETVMNQYKGTGVNCMIAQ